MDKLKIIRKIGRFFVRKHYWIVSDRPTIAGDNGEAFFRYLQDKKGITPVFAIQTDGSDYERMKKIGKVVIPWTLKHKIILCLADVFLSSQLHFFEKTHTETPLVFLQHGVTEKDISKYINPYCRENFYVITSTNDEYESFTRQPYQIRPENVWLTGLPRFDNLVDTKQKKIIISLTWQENLASYNNPTDEDFMKSDFYKCMSEIMNSKRIKDAAEENGYELYAKLHPMLGNFSNVFKCPEYIKSWDRSYQDMFAEASLIVTDYSSIVFDFAMLKKVVVYYQPENDIPQNHVWSTGDYSYEEKGFGEVTKTIEELEDVLIEYMKSDCVLKDKYKRRIEDCFTYMDNKCCERVYQKTVEMIQTRKE